MKIQRPISKQPIPEHARCVFKGVVFDVYQWEQELYDGKKVIFEKLKRSDTAVVFPVLPDGKIILIKEEQPGKKLFIGATGGHIDEGEEILAAAKRELLEESGYEAERFELWKADQPSSKIDWVIYTFVAKGLKKISQPQLDGGEKIKLYKVTFDEFINVVQDERFAEKEIVKEVLEARLDQKKMEKLRKLFDPNL